MRRMLALLLAVLFLPAAALAEAFCLDVTVDMEPDAAAEAIRQTGIFAGAENEAELAAAFVDFMDGFHIRLTTQEDAVYLDMLFDDAPLLDLSLLMTGEEYVLTSDLLDGAGFSIPAATQESVRLQRLLENTDWAGLATGMLTAAFEAFSGAQIVQTRGCFAGDAYTGGVYCDTVYLDDQLIAKALDAMMTRQAGNVVTYLGVCLGMDGDALLEQLSALHAKAAEENAHRYILRIVRDANHVLIGLSLTVMKEESQLATLSVGISENGLRIVAGLPMDAVNYWHVHDIAWAEETGADGVTKYSLSGTIKEFTAEKNLDFSMASAYITETRFTAQWTADIGMQSGGLSWKTAVSTRVGDTLIIDKTENQGLYIPGMRFANTTTYTRNGKLWMTENALLAPCSPMAVDADSLTLYSLAAADQTQINELSWTMGAELAMRLLQILPMELLLYFQ